MSWDSHVRCRADKLCSVGWANEMGCLQAQNGSGICCAMGIQIFFPLKASIFFLWSSLHCNSTNLQCSRKREFRFTLNKIDFYVRVNYFPVS